MEQQDTIQSLAESSKDSKSLGEWAQETTELSLNDVSVPYEFRDGAYYCEGVEGGYMSLTALRRAWGMKLRATKMREAHAQSSGVGKASKNEKDKEKARKEYRKWQQTEIQ